MENNIIKNITESLYNFSTIYSEGFTNGEIDQFLKKEVPSVTIVEVNSSLIGSTYVIINGEPVTYKHDLLSAIFACIRIKEILFKK